MGFAGPFTQVDQFTAFTTKGSPGILRVPLNHLATGRAFYSFNHHEVLEPATTQIKFYVFAGLYRVLLGRVQKTNAKAVFAATKFSVKL